MKIGEKVNYDKGTDQLIIEKKFSNEPYLKMAKEFREAGTGMTGESRLAGVSPMHVLKELLKEAGVDWSDTHACQEIVKKKLLSGDFDKLRVWNGTY